MPWVIEVNLPFKYMIMERERLANLLTRQSQAPRVVVAEDTKEIMASDKEARMACKIS